MPTKKKTKLGPSSRLRTLTEIRGAWYKASEKLQRAKSEGSKRYWTGVVDALAWAIQVREKLL